VLLLLEPVLLSDGMEDFVAAVLAETEGVTAAGFGVVFALPVPVRVVGCTAAQPSLPAAAFLLSLLLTGAGDVELTFGAVGFFDVVAGGGLLLPLLPLLPAAGGLLAGFGEVLRPPPVPNLLKSSL